MLICNSSMMTIKVKNLNINTTNAPYKYITVVATKKTCESCSLSLSVAVSKFIFVFKPLYYHFYNTKRPYSKINFINVIIYIDCNINIQMK